jgi:hypothetical protein
MNDPLYFAIVLGIASVLFIIHRFLKDKSSNFFAEEVISDEEMEVLKKQAILFNPKLQAVLDDFYAKNGMLLTNPMVRRSLHSALKKLSLRSNEKEVRRLKEGLATAERMKAKLGF